MHFSTPVITLLAIAAGVEAGNSGSGSSSGSGSGAGNTPASPSSTGFQPSNPGAKVSVPQLGMLGAGVGSVAYGALIFLA
ncbi:hypothetical protein F1880_007724 [Penicillium rolfsii]|nr:hypothetical protein F1880_007724 [Penicillium rolfsii]